MKQSLYGFTLIELVIVIVILGILSAIAAPKFINLTGDARVAALEGLKTQMQGQRQLTYSKSIIARNKNEADTTLDIGSDTIEIAYGQPKAKSAQTWSKLIDATIVDSQFNPNTPADWYFHNTNNAGTPYIRFKHPSKKFSSDNCYLKYTQAAGINLLPTFEIEKSGC